MVRRGVVAAAVAACLAAVAVAPATATSATATSATALPATTVPVVTGSVPALAAGRGLPADTPADTLGDARRQAEQLRVELDALQDRLEAADEDRAGAQAALDDSVGREIGGAQQVDAVAAARNARNAELVRAVRALYMGGGAPGLYAAVLDATTLADVARRSADASSILAGKLQGVEAADRALARAQQLQAARQDGTGTRLAALARARTAAATARAIRDTIKAKLAAADSTVLALLEEQRRRAAEAERVRAAAALRAAGQATYTGPLATGADEVAALDRAIAAAAAQPVHPWAAAALADARRWLGAPYSAGGGGVNGPSTGWCSDSAPDDGRDGSGACAASRTVGFDCSSLMLRIFSAAGYALPRTSRQQWLVGRHVSLQEIGPGDLLFWAYDTSNPSSIHHVAVYLGNGLMLHAPHTGDRVRVARVYTSGLIGAVRPA